ncbi:MAG: hypothetical protein M1368_12520 [Thaumarchaeota archaeon]|nr:hypothetical protein [Nitrososphaerota archaeon]
MNGTSITGFYAELRVDGTPVQSGFTPVKFSNLTAGVQYMVVAYWHVNYLFRHYDGNLIRYHTVTINGSGSIVLSAMYVPPSQAATLNVIAEFSNGTFIGPL